MKKIMEKPVSKFAGNIVLWFTLISVALSICICETGLDLIEWFAATLIIGVGIALLDIMIREEKADIGKPRSDYYIKAETNLNW